ncbi:MAG: DUF2007 domain-containing protein [Anaerolineae bacterium]
MSTKAFDLPRWLRAGVANILQLRSATTTGGSTQSEDPVEVYVAANELEAQVIRAFLESNAIPVMLRGEALGQVYGLVVGKFAEVRVFVPHLLAEKAQVLLKETMEAQPADDEIAADPSNDDFDPETV